MGREPVDIFHPLIAGWFRSRYGEATEAQGIAWPLIAAGKNVLLSAPTGTGKTYSAFLYAIDRLLRGAWESGAVRVLYVSPLKALNTDIAVNLTVPLSEITEQFRAAGESCPEILVQTRSGDTPEVERRRMLRRPPEILITTPESLNLILSSPNARSLLAGVRTVIVDEIHSIIGSKRGTHLITAIDRLVLLAGEFQRIGLSATVRPIETAAAFLGGYLVQRNGERWSYEPRPVEIVRAAESKTISLGVRYPQKTAGVTGDAFWTLLAAELRGIITKRRSTLIFVNSRRLAERLTHEINEDEILAYPHHGSLSRELRSVVEKRMKSGELQAIVATSSLELGIDIGDLDEVLLVETPMSVAGAVQRIGRAGHSVGEVSSGTLFVSHGMDLVRAAVAAPMVVAQDIEEARPVLAPLDVLAQLILSMTSIAAWRLDELYGFLRSSFPYHSLTRRQFDLVVEMLEGRFEESRLRELKARVSVDRIDGTIRAKEGVRYLLYSGGGTIPDRGYFGLHVRDSGAKIGELDEEFVWERRVGDAFVLGSQRWRIVGIDHQRVTVIPWKGSVNSSPFWKAERQLRSFHFSSKIGEALEEWESVIERRSSFSVAVPANLDAAAADDLERFLRRQRETTGCALPHRHHIVAEHTGRDPRYILLHTLWGGRVNEPLALALSTLLRRDFVDLDVAADNETVVLVLPEEGPEYLSLGLSGGEVPRAHELLRRLAGENLERLIAESLESSGFFGARFRENAGRALLLPRLRAGRRMPLWVTRLRAKRLLEHVQRYRDFPIVAETWRECIRDDFDLDSLRSILEEVRDGTIRVSEVSTPAPSPFASGIAWLQTNQYLYGDDVPAGGRSSSEGGSLTTELLREMVFTPELRVRIPQAIAERFERKLKRTAPGYAPRDAGELLDWLKERLLIPFEEWLELLAAVVRDGGPSSHEVEVDCAERIIGMSFPGGSRFMAALEQRTRIERAFFAEESTDNLTQVLSEWLAFEIPIGLERVEELFGVGVSEGSVRRDRFESAIAELCEEERVVRGSLKEGSTEAELCDAENLERLLSFIRRESAVLVQTRPIAQLPVFLAEWQGVRTLGRAGSRQAAGALGTSAAAAPGPGPPSDDETLLPAALERLFGYPAKAGIWETDLLPARLAGYRRHWLDRLLRDTDLEWFGCGRETVSFRFSPDTELFSEPLSTQSSPSSDGPRPLFAEQTARYTYWDLQARSGLAAGEFTSRLWSEVWEGRISSDSFEPVRRGVMSGFRGSEPHTATVRGGRGAFGKWKSQTALAGTWYLNAPVEVRDLIAELEISKDRVRLLVDRYGILFRELLERELPELRWGRLFRTMRLMELSGEIVSGRFFEEIPGLQFASFQAVKRLDALSLNDRFFWINAVDSASPCGLGLTTRTAVSAGPGIDSGNDENEGSGAGMASEETAIGELGLKWPSRLPSTHLVFHGASLVLVSRRLGSELWIGVSPQSAELESCFGLFEALVERDYEPEKSIKVEKINGTPVRESPYRDALKSFGFEEDFKSYTYRGGGRS